VHRPVLTDGRDMGDVLSLQQLPIAVVERLSGNGPVSFGRRCPGYEG
jgi:hypothetical protein